MSQTWNLPFLGTDFAHVVLKENVPNALEALRTCFSGASAPASPVPFQFWFDTTENLLKQRNSASTAWLVVANLNDDALATLQSVPATISATTTIKLGLAPKAAEVVRLLLCSDAASVSSSGIEWTFQLKRYPAATPGSPVNLFSGTIGTFTALSGQGGTEFVAHAGKALVPNQNETATAFDELELVMTKVGAATSLTLFQAAVHLR
jgi:hypothetical protein